jgi:hypothetical protein
MSARQTPQLAEFPPTDIPAADPPNKLWCSARTPPIGRWVLSNPKPSAHGWHICCPSCVDGRVLLGPDPSNAFEYQMLLDSCTAGCGPASVMRWHAYRLGEPEIWFDWLKERKAARRAAA